MFKPFASLYRPVSSLTTVLKRLDVTSNISSSTNSSTSTLTSPPIIEIPSPAVTPEPPCSGS